MSLQKFHLLFVGLSVMVGCSSPKFLVPEPLPLATIESDSMEVRNLDTLVVSADEREDSTTLPAEQPLYRETASRVFDLLHTKLDLHFDWSSESVIGSAELTLTPYFYPDSILTLDAINFQIDALTVNGVTAKYDYDGEELKIHLGKLFHHKEEVKIYTQYRATPTRGDDGSAAITSDQGLFFINADHSDPMKPQQIWTQGETEFNSRWFPTIDKPNERCTGDIILTVDTTFITLSNGALKTSVENGDGTRTDHWVMEIPHAPYLFMIAVGDFAKVSDLWNGKEVSYYVEHEYAEDARDIFAHTPEMLSFFSKITGLDFPWPKYSQIIVRDYVSGAMENTTAVIFGEFIQKHKRELIDNHNDGIVAHEMFHHWFGDYVTCESWSNLTLNEGFANYAEYLWLEHKYGRDEAENHRIEEIQGYLYQASQEVHPLIDFQYADKENMFDAHSYNKGGLVLHMLRNLLGDDAFFKSLNLYLQKHALSAVEVHDLRLAFEQVSGLDLNWFFNQWYLSEGHPILDFTSHWSEENRSIELTITQSQDGSLPLFVLPTTVELVYSNNQRIRREITIDSREEKIIIPSDEEPLLVVLDPERSLLAIINDSFDPNQYQLLYHPSNALAIRSLAISKLVLEDTPENQSVIMDALEDPYWAIRRAALSAFDWETRNDALDKLAMIAKQDPHSLVRADAIYLLGNLAQGEYKEIIAGGINNEDPYPVVAASILALRETDLPMTMERLAAMESEQQSDIVAAISMIYGESSDTTKLEYFEEHLTTVEGLPSLDFFESLEILLKSTSASTKMEWMDKLEKVASGSAGISPYTKIAATRNMISLLKSAEKKKSLLSDTQLEELRQKINRVINQETNPQIITIYQNFMNS